MLYNNYMKIEGIAKVFLYLERMETIMEEKDIEISNSKGWGIASLVLGIFSIIFIRFIILSIMFAVLAIIFGIMSKIKKEKSLGKAGLTLGIISLSITLVLFIVLNIFDTSLFMVPKWYR